MAQSASPGSGEMWGTTEAAEYISSVIGRRVSRQTICNLGKAGYLRDQGRKGNVRIFKPADVMAWAERNKEHIPGWIKNSRPSG